MESLADALKNKKIQVLLERQRLPYVQVKNRLVSDPNLTPADKVTAFALATFASTEGKQAFPRQEKIAERAALSVRQIKYSLASLERAGWVERTKTWKLYVYKLKF